ncbi:Meiosis specific protein SPO22 [Metarhizium rileyi]|uniref:Meiosis specific protein SPO22 n=1 Tax=Metarhizium rileyi (strain RCEF 4871) TaxID=1649241 RepID=A0A167CKT5_METRR|nr:Meiosis specific protein SPO22 [Metarhizium rileyi RCEF 4871]
MEHSHSNGLKTRDLIEISTLLQTALSSQSCNDDGLDLYLSRVETGLRAVNLWTSAPTVVTSCSLRKLQVQGQVLWNMCVRRRRNLTDEPSRCKVQKLVLRSWILAFLLFELCRSRAMASEIAVAEAEYLLGLALTVTTASVNDSELGVAKLAMQRGAVYVNYLESASDAWNFDSRRMPPLQAAYYSFRIWVSWREDRLDVAEHMFCKADPFRRGLDDIAVENLAYILHYVGLDLVSKRNLDSGMKWLNRGFRLLSAATCTFSPKAEHLYLAICNDLIEAMRRRNLLENAEEIQSMLNLALPKTGHHPVLLHCQLMVMDITEELDRSEKGRLNLVQRMVSSPELSESTLYLSFYHLLRLGDTCSPSDLLDELLFRHAVPTENVTLVGKALFLRMWIELRMVYNHEGGLIIGDVVEKVYQSIRTQLSWAEAEACQADHELGRESLKAIASIKDMRHIEDVLYACCSEVKSFEDKLCALEVLKALYEQPTKYLPDAINVPTLLRCAIRLMQAFDMDHHHEGTRNDEESHFAAAKYATSRSETGKAFPITELDWFRKNAYNLAVLKSHEWREKHIIRLASTCISLTSCYPSTIPAHQADELATTLLRSHFIISAFHLAQARNSVDPPKRHHFYSEVRHHTAEYRKILHTSTQTGNAAHQDLKSKLATLLVYDFEAAMALSHTEDLETIIQFVKPHKDALPLKAMADMLLRSPLPAKVFAASLETIIREIHIFERFDARKLCRQVRIMFQTVLPISDAAALQLFGRIIQITHESRMAGASLSRLDLEWIVATAFNHAIDFYARGQETACRVWAVKAIELAGHLDEGALAQFLRDRFAQLRFEQDE